MSTSIKFPPFGQFANQVRSASARVNKALAENQAEEARKLVPVRTGALRDSIHVDQDRDGTAYMIAGNEKVDYAASVEYGSAVSGTGAHPFSTPAREKTIGKADQIVRRVKGL